MRTRRSRGARVAVGRCWACQGPVLPYEAVHIFDYAVTRPDGRPVRRLTHRGDCEDRVRAASQGMGNR